MARDNSRYQQMETYMTFALIAGTGFFILFLIFAGYGITWLKVITAILTIAISILSLGVLFLTQELKRHRSLWMTTAAAALILCTTVSLIAGFPCPDPRTAPVASEPSTSKIAHGQILNENGILLLDNQTGDSLVID